MSSPIHPTNSRLNTMSAVRRELARLYRDCRTGRVPVSEGSRLTYMLMSLGRLIEMENATVEDMEYGQRNVYGIPSWISKREWMEKYRSGPVVVVQEGQSQTQPERLPVVPVPPT